MKRKRRVWFLFLTLPPDLAFPACFFEFVCERKYYDVDRYIFSILYICDTVRYFDYEAVGDS